MTDLISVTEADFSREIPCRFWDPSRKFLRAIRRYQYWQKTGLFAKVMQKMCVVRFHIWSIVTGADIPHLRVN